MVKKHIRKLLKEPTVAGKVLVFLLIIAALLLIVTMAVALVKLAQT